MFSKSKHGRVLYLVPKYKVYEALDEYLLGLIREDPEFCTHLTRTEHLNVYQCLRFQVLFQKF